MPPKKKAEPPPPPPEPEPIRLKIAIIGLGPVGAALGASWARANHEVRFGLPEPSSAPLTAKQAEALAAVPGATAGPIGPAVAWAEAVVLTLPGAHTEAKLAETAALLGGPAATAQKLVIDTTNPLSPYPALAVRWAEGVSGTERLQQLLPGALLAKAFSTVGAEHLAHPDGSLLGPAAAALGGGPMTMLCCGHPDRRAMLELMVTAAGFASTYVGPVRYARNLDAVAELVIHLAVPSVGETEVDWGRNWHLQLCMKKPAPPEGAAGAGGAPAAPAV